MYYLIAYDIASARRLRRVVTLCKDHGQRIQKSVFECHLTTEQFTHLWQKLLNVLDKEADHVVAYPICQSCLKQVRQYPALTFHATAPSVYIF